MKHALALLLGSVLDFITDPFAWVGIAALIVSRKSKKAVRYRPYLRWAFWVGCGIAVLNRIVTLVRYW